MFTSICLLSCVLAAGQPTAKADWQLTPQLVPGVELVYNGSYTEESLIPNVAHQTTYRLDANLLVLDAGVKNWQVAIMTSLSLRQHRQPTSNNDDGPTSLRLELARVDTQGRLRQDDKKPLEIPLKEPPTTEFGFFAPAPLTPIGRNFTWEVAEPDRPTQYWQVLGTESCGGVACIKIAASQQSADWDHVRADTIGWRRRDTLWIHPQLFVAQKVERIIEQRAAARDTPTARTLVKYELQSQLRYPGRLFEDRKAEALKTAKFQEDAQLLLRQPTLNRQLADALIHRIAFHLEHTQSQQETPYRRAALHIKEDLEKGKKGELAVRSPSDDMPPLPIKSLQVGQRAPDFTASSLIEDKTYRLGEYHGTPVLLVFYNPGTALGREVIVFAKKLSDRHGQNLAVAPLAVTQDIDVVRLQHKELGLTFPILDGAGLRLSYGAMQTPHFVLVDGDGTVRFVESGWGYHTSTVIDAGVRQCQKR